MNYKAGDLSFCIYNQNPKFEYSTIFAFFSAGLKNLKQMLICKSCFDQTTRKLLSEMRIWSKQAQIICFAAFLF